MELPHLRRDAARAVRGVDPEGLRVGVVGDLDDLRLALAFEAGRGPVEGLGTK